MRDDAEAAGSVVDVDRVSKHYGEVAALTDVSFAAAAGSTLALLGGNGAGKTTTISILLGLLLPSSGRVRVLGHVVENLTVYAHLYGLARPKARIGELAAALDLEGFLDRPTGDLSSGQRTRVALAKAMLNAPRLLLLDEPTASLDPDTADWVRGYLQAYQRESGATIVLASHNMGEVERLCDDVVMMRAGSIVDRGSPAELIARYGRDTLEEVFLDIARDRRKPFEDAKTLASR